MSFSPRSIKILGEVLEARTGQQLGTARLLRVETVLQSLLRREGHQTVDALAARLEAGDSALCDAVAEALLNHESFFFRDPAAFSQLVRLIAARLHPARVRERRLRLWSAGCSTGQEAYSLAISFAEQAELWQGWTIELLATDISTAVLERARSGRFSQFEIQRGLPVRQMLRWFEPDGEDWVAIDALKSRVRFQHHNLLDPPPITGPCDVILCRNVMIYFPAPVREAVFGRLYRAAASDGVLMLGAGETVLGQTSLFEADPEVRGLYRPVPAGAGICAA